MLFINSTIISLSVSSLLTQSPYYTFTKFSSFKQTSIFDSSRFSRFFASVIQSSNSNIGMKVSNSIFSHTLSSAIYFASDHCSLGPSRPLKLPIRNQIFGEGDDWSGWNDHHIYFHSKCYDTDSFYIAGCQFINCFVTLKGTQTEGNEYNSDTTGGGAVFVNYETCSITIHETIFNNCSTESKRGGALFITGGCQNSNNGNFEDTLAQYVDIQFCCFEHCFGYGKNGDLNVPIYGSAAFLASNQTILYFAATINCSNTYEIEGAQFDIQAVNVTSHSVNITGGKALYCAGMEYRRAQTGYFKFQTIHDTYGSFVTAYTNIAIKEDQLSYCNLVNNTLRNDKSVPHGLIHAIGTSIEIQHFYFISNNLNEGGFATRQTNNNITIRLTNCYSNHNGSVAEYVTTNDCNFAESNEITLLHLTQLNLADCKGEKTPEPFIFSSTFTPTIEFSPSSVFTSSKSFTNSADFSDSSAFEKNKYFSNSNRFTASVSFTKSSSFSETNQFSDSSEFTISQVFTHSSQFSKTIDFSASSNFTLSITFQKTDDFSESISFTQSNDFSNSELFSNSISFTKSNIFSNSEKFSDSTAFSESISFTKSIGFSDSELFSDSIYFTQSDGFTKSNNFGQTATFSSSDYFTKSTFFSNSEKFTTSTEFTLSTGFTLSEVFTQSQDLNRTKTFEPSLYFSNSYNFTTSNTFTPLAADIQIDINSQDGGSQKKTFLSIIAAVGCAVVASIIVAAIIISRRRKLEESQPSEAIGEVQNPEEDAVVLTNPLKDLVDNSDPFEEDFGGQEYVL